MHDYASASVSIWASVAIGNLLLENTSQSVGIVIVGVGGEIAQEVHYMVVELREARLPPKRHYDMLVYEGRIGYYAALLVCPLIERNGQGAYLRADGLLELTASVVGLNPRLLHSIGIDEARDGYGRYLGTFIGVLYIRDEGEEERVEAFGLFVPDFIRGLINVVTRGEQEVISLVGDIDIAPASDISPVVLLLHPSLEGLIEATFRTAWVSLIQALKTYGVEGFLSEKAVKGVASRPQGFPFLAGVYLRRCPRLDGFEVHKHPRPFGDIIEVAPVLRLDDLLRLDNLSYNILGMPTSEDDEFLRLVMQTGSGDFRVPIPRGLTDERGVRFLRILVEVIQDENIHGLGGQRAAATHDPQRPRVPDNLEDIGVAQVVRCYGYDIRAIEGSIGKDRPVLLAIDNPLDIAVEVLGDGSGVGADGYFRVGEKPENIRGKEAARPLALSVLRWGLDYEFLNLPMRELIENLVVSDMKRRGIEGWAHPSCKMQEVSPRPLSKEEFGAGRQ